MDKLGKLKMSCLYKYKAHLCLKTFKKMTAHYISRCSVLLDTYMFLNLYCPVIGDLNLPLLLCWRLNF